MVAFSASRPAVGSSARTMQVHEGARATASRRSSPPARFPRGRASARARQPAQAPRPLAADRPRQLNDP